MAADEQYRTEVLCHFSVSKQRERQFASSTRDVSIVLLSTQEKKTREQKNNIKAKRLIAGNTARPKKTSNRAACVFHKFIIWFWSLSFISIAVREKKEEKKQRVVTCHGFGDSQNCCLSRERMKINDIIRTRWPFT